MSVVLVSSNKVQYSQLHHLPCHALHEKLTLTNDNHWNGPFSVRYMWPVSFVLHMLESDTFIGLCTCTAWMLPFTARDWGYCTFILKNVNLTYIIANGITESYATGSISTNADYSLIVWCPCKYPGPTFSKLLRKILGSFLIFGQSLTISGKTLTRHNFAILTNSQFNNLTSRNNIQHDAKMSVLITIINALLFRNMRLVLC